MGAPCPYPVQCDTLGICKRDDIAELEDWYCNNFTVVTNNCLSPTPDAECVSSGVKDCVSGHPEVGDVCPDIIGSTCSCIPEFPAAIGPLLVSLGMGLPILKGYLKRLRRNERLEE